MAGLLYFLLVIWPNKVRMRSIPYLQVNNPGEDTIHQEHVEHGTKGLAEHIGPHADPVQS